MSATSSSMALVTTALAKDYGDRPALEPLDLAVPRGQHVALVGHNGSGKTTLLRMASGLLEPSSGTVSVVGHAAGSLEARKALSWLSDTPTFYHHNCTLVNSDPGPSSTRSDRSSVSSISISLMSA